MSAVNTVIKPAMEEISTELAVADEQAIDRLVFAQRVLVKTAL